MIIKKLELQGFKSFPERTKILFHPGITIIVGPNGTGKSNIVDAILWVLGGRRIKYSRGERTEDIIFHGNEKKAPLGLADVVLYLGDNEEEMIINHRLFRSGESSYRLNGKSVRVKDIQESLWKKNIAEKEYFTIEQGSIERILTSKPVEKRQFLEEAAGIAYYKEKKRQAQLKLENSEQNLIRLEDIIAEVSKAKNSLKRQANAAIRYRKLREKIRQLTQLHYRQKTEQLERRKAEVAESYDRFLTQEKEIISQIKTEETKLQVKNREIWNLEKSLKERRDKLFSLKSELARAESELKTEEKRIEFFREKRKKAKLNIQELKEELALLQKEIGKAEKGLTDLSQSYRKNLQSLEKATKENQAAHKEMARLEKQMQSSRKARLQKISEHTELRNEKAKTEKEIELIIRQEEKVQSQAENEKILLQEKEKIIGQNRKTIAQANKLEREKTNKIREFEKALSKTIAAVESLQNKISQSKDKQDAALHQLQVLERLGERERIQQVSEDFPEAVGFLTEMVETDPEYEHLIDTFWKEEARSLLISSHDFLKHVGKKEMKGNFLLLSPRKKEDLSPELSQHPEVKGFFKSFLRASPKLEKYLSSFRDAVIVQDIKSAIQLWLKFPSYNYLTAKGDLLLSSGLMKLGEKEEGIFAITQEIKRLKKNIEHEKKYIAPLINNLDERKQEKQKLEEKLQRETQKLREAEIKADEMEKKNMIEEAEKGKIANAISLLCRELDMLKEDKHTLIQRGEDLSSKQKRQEEEERRINKELEIEEEKLVMFREQNKQGEKYLYELKANNEVIQEKIANLENQILTLNQRKENTESKIDSLQQEIRSSEEDEFKSKEKIKNLSDKNKKFERVKNEKETLDGKEESLLQNIKQESVEKEKRVQNLREKQEAVKEERVKWEVKKAEIERDIVNLEENCWQDLKKTLEEVKKETSEEEGINPETEETLEELKENLQKFKAVNLMAEEEYLIQKKRYDFLLQQSNDLRSSIDSTQKAIKKIDQESRVQFLKALDEVNKHFQDVFALLFEGGAAELKLQDPNNPLEAGIEINAQPPGKKLQSMALLSGGEKALTSLAFLFALFRYKPTPFCILDEVDAALDDANLARFLELMKKIKNQTQFIIVTHNYKTMEVADYIYGTTMAEPNETTLYSLKLEKEGTG